jgi:hypothetical protein
LLGRRRCAQVVVRCGVRLASAKRGVARSIRSTKRVGDIDSLPCFEQSGLCHAAGVAPNLKPASSGRFCHSPTSSRTASVTRLMRSGGTSVAVRLTDLPGRRRGGDLAHQGFHQRRQLLPLRGNRAASDIRPRRIGLAVDTRRSASCLATSILESDWRKPESASTRGAPLRNFMPRECCRAGVPASCAPVTPIAIRPDGSTENFPLVNVI